MKYFIDTEFIEGPQKESFPISLFRKETPNTIDLISIGIVAEDCREYYAISKDFNLKEAWNRYDEKIEMPSGDMRNRFPNGYIIKTYWLRENVLKPIYIELQNRRWNDNVKSGNHNQEKFDFCFKDFKRLVLKYGKTNKEIAWMVKHFCSIGTAYSSMDKSSASIMHFVELGSIELEKIKEKDLKFVFNEIPEFYAYYADYDWVVFCWLFGKMIDLPKGFPMYCKDLKQMIDDEIAFINDNRGDKNSPLVTAKSMKENNQNYPKQDSSKSHNAIEDARWNKQLYEFLTQL